MRSDCSISSTPEGFLSQPDKKVKEYVLAPPLLPPAAAVLLDLNSYETLVLASKPAYNLEELSPFIPQSVYDQIQRREAWLPRACHPGYAPASPFKLVTALAGIRHSVLNPEEKILCKGIHRGMECHVFPGSHGEVSFVRQLPKVVTSTSSNARKGWGTRHSLKKRSF